MTIADLAERDFRRILLIKPSSPGDIIHALPVLHGLRRRYPAAHIAWLVATPFANLIEIDPALNEVIPFDRRRFGRLGRSLAVTGEFVAFMKTLRDKSFDLVVDLQGLFRSGFLAFGSGAGVRIGPPEGRELSWMFYTHRIPKGDTRDEHAVEKNLRLGRMLGFDASSADFSIAMTADDRAIAASLLDEAGIRGSDRFAVLVPGTRWETKCWPPDRFGFLARRLFDEHGVRSVLVGGAGDVAAGAIAVGTSGGAAASLCGRTTLRELAALIERATMVVTADSTPMHMAVALQRPLIALFGPTNPHRTGPYRRMEDVLRIDLECSPCYFKKMSQCPYKHACMQRLDVEMVLERVVDQVRFDE